MQQRQRLASASPTFRSQKHLNNNSAYRPRLAKHHRSCNYKVVFFSSLLCFLVSLLLFAKRPPTSISPPLPTPHNPPLPAAERYGIFENSPSKATLSTKPQLLSFNSSNFTLDAVPIRLISGSVHYFRMPPSSWRPVLELAKHMGLNTIATYVPWNLHEQSRGVFRWSGMLDLRSFLELCRELELLILLRPGPYICSEWDLGGLPPFLLKEEGETLRSLRGDFMGEVERFFGEVGRQIGGYIGRPIVGIQIENEYGAFGSDRGYLRSVLGFWAGLIGERVLYFTSDNGGTGSVRNGSPFEKEDRVVKTVNLEHGAREKVKMLKWLQPEAPAMIAEFWVGWFDHWGEVHHTRDGREVVEKVREAVVDLEASVNLYMFFGGTNFGFMAGANIDDGGMYLADVTSYDYDAFVTEFGTVRKEKYTPMQNMLRQFWTDIGNKGMLEAMSGKMPKEPIMSGYAGRVALDESIPLFEVLDIVADYSVWSEQPLTMEALGGDYGFVLYRHNLTAVPKSENVSSLLRISGVRDFAYILLDGKVVKTIDRNRELERLDGQLKSTLIPPGASTLDIIVENRGRVNYGKHLHDRKGIVGNVTIDGKPVEGFECITMSFPQDHEMLRDVFGRETLSIVRTMMFGRADHAPMNDASSPPTFFRGEMTINPGSRAAFKGELPGTHCRVYGRGILWVNGFNVGRFYTGVSGPQRTLFVPGVLLREGRNEFLVLHMNMHLAREPPIAQLFEDPQLGRTIR